MSDSDDDNFNDEQPTVRIPRETMWQARERSQPAHIAWGADAAHGEGFTPIGPSRPTRELRPTEAPQEHTHVDGVPEPIDAGDDTEPMLLSRAS